MFQDDEHTKIAMPSEQDPFPTGTMVQQRYRIEGVLGRGGMSVVYIARHDALNRTVALKVPTSPSTSRERARFLREARAAAAIQHPNVCRIFDYGEQDGLPFLVMEYLDGRTLLDWMIEEDTFRPEDAVGVARQILAALGAAHATGFLHRDVKPANVILRGEPPKVKLVDFGLAKPLSPRPSDPTLTATGVTVGTRPYMSPEQLSGRRDLDVRCDVYAVGAVTFHMLSGKLPFPGEGLELALEIASGSHLDLGDLVPGLPYALVNAVHKAIRVQRGDRFPDTVAFSEALRASLRPDIEPPPPSAPPPSEDPKARLKALLSHQDEVSKRRRGGL